MLIIANPISANGATGLRWSGVEARLRSEGLTFDVKLTESPGHATELAREAAQEGYETVVCAGGDGTLNEVINGLMTVDEPARPKLGLIPSGTGTDFARGLNLPKDLDDVAVMLARGLTQPIDVGFASFRRANQTLTRYFVNVAGVGFDGEVSDAVNRNGKRGGSLTYFVNVFRVLASYENKRARVALVEANQKEKVIESEFNLVAVCNGRYFGGGMMVGPNADVSDGRFDVIIIEAMSRLEFAMNFLKVYRGVHLSHPKVSEYRAAEVLVELLPPPGSSSSGRGSSQRMFLEAEGELFGEAPVTIRILPSALRLIT
jgi:YegS/Rv2252/BmrU family lipid kinase